MHCTTCKRPVTQNPIAMLVESTPMILAYRHSSTVFEVSTRNMLPATISIDKPHSSENLVESWCRVSARNRSLDHAVGIGIETEFQIAR